jgi:hypothetical protein
VESPESGNWRGIPFTSVWKSFFLPQLISSPRPLSQPHGFPQKIPAKHPTVRRQCSTWNTRRTHPAQSGTAHLFHVEQMCCFLRQYRTPTRCTTRETERHSPFSGVRFAAAARHRHPERRPIPASCRIISLSRSRRSTRFVSERASITHCPFRRADMSANSIRGDDRALQEL